HLYLKTLAAADQVVLVGEQTVPSIRALRLISDALHKEEGIRTEKLVINRYNPKISGFSASHLEDLLKVPPLRTIAHDPAVTAAVNNGRPLRLEAPRSQALADIDTLVHDFLAIDKQPEAKTHGSAVFGRLIQAFGMA